MRLCDVKFKKRFCVNYYRNLTLPMGEMSLHKDWINTNNRGDAYPLTESAGNFSETVKDETYTVDFKSKGSVRRLLFAYFPWYSYDVDFTELSGEIGFALTSPSGTAEIVYNKCGLVKITTPTGEYSGECEQKCSGTLSLSFRGRGVSVYFVDGARHTLVLDTADEFIDSLRKESLLSDSKIQLVARADGGRTVVSGARAYLHAGISQADLRPAKYEDGTPIIENGRVFVTATARSIEYKYQVVLSWCPTACDFKLEGALFFDMGDGYLCDDVASSLIYDRNASEWRIAMCAFSHGHIIGFGKPVSDPRFGINIIDIETMKPGATDDDKTKFVAFEGDEDPEMIFHGGKWYLSICRCESDGYHYYHFTSYDLKSFEFLARTDGYEKTGGSYVKAADGVYFACGSDFKKRAVYDLYSIDNLSTPIKNLECDFDDGGFRGWGSVIMLPIGSRYRYVWITFDRHLGSHFNWSYGNIHVFESESFKL